MHRGTIVFLILLLGVAGPAQALFANGSENQENVLFAQGLGDELDIIAARADVTILDAQGRFGFYGVESARVTGLDQVCFEGGACHDASAGALVLEVLPGSSFGLSLDGAADVEFSMAFGYTTFVDLSHEPGLPAVTPGESIISSGVGGHLDAFAVDGAVAGTAAVIEQNGGIRVLQAGQDRGTVRTGDAPLRIQGTPSMAPFDAQMFLLPFPDGSFGSFDPADSVDAFDGTKPEVFDSAAERMLALRAVPTDITQFWHGRFENYRPLISEVLNPAHYKVDLTNPDPSLESTEFTRFKTLTVDGRDSFTQWTSTAAFSLGQSSTEGGLAGVFVFDFLVPWWSLLLFELAVLAIALYLILRPGEQRVWPWDEKDWVGATFATAMVVAVFIFWGLEMQAILGMSIFSGVTASGIGLGAILALHWLAMITGFLLFGVPLYLAMRFGLLAGGQGRFMDLPIGLSVLFSFFLALPVMATILGFWLAAVA